MKDNTKISDFDMFNDAEESFIRKVLRSSEINSLELKHRDSVLELLGMGRRSPDILLESDVKAVRKFSDLMTKEFLWERRRRKKINFPMFHVTILREESLTGNINPLLGLTELQKVVRTILMKEFGNFYARTEIQGCNNRNHAHGGHELCPHIHAVAWAHSDISTDAVRGRMTKVFGERVGDVPSVKISPIGDTLEDLKAVVRYGLKRPNKLKTVYIHPKTGKQNLHESEAGDRFIRYARLFEIQCHIPLWKMVFGGGEGHFLLGRAKLGTNRWHAGRPHSQTLMRMSDVGDFWDRIRHQWPGQRFSKPIVE